MKVSAVVATRNRAERLAQALRSFERVRVPDRHTWEVIVADNGSTDGTDTIVRACQERARVPVAYLVEPRPGKSYALNAGVDAATGDVVAFTDDDCLVAPDWLEAMVAEFSADATLAGFGGRVELYSPLDQPYTIRTLTTRDVFTPRKLTTLIVGCNMAFRKTVLDRVGRFDPTLGPGSRAAEDFDLLYRIHKAGFPIVYTPNVVVYHNRGRRTDDDVRRLYVGYGVSLGAFYCKYVLQRDTEILRMACRHGLTILYGAGKRLIGRRPPRPNRIRIRDLIEGAAIQGARRVRSRTATG